MPGSPLYLRNPSVSYTRTAIERCHPPSSIQRKCHPCPPCVPPRFASNRQPQRAVERSRRPLCSQHPLHPLQVGGGGLQGFGNGLLPGIAISAFSQPIVARPTLVRAKNSLHLPSRPQHPQATPLLYAGYDGKNIVFFFFSLLPINAEPPFPSAPCLNGDLSKHRSVGDYRPLHSWA